jgi:hypothetical protein
MAGNDLEYYRAREAHCRSLAEQCTDPAQTRIHLSLAELHRKRCADIESRSRTEKV